MTETTNGNLDSDVRRDNADEPLPASPRRRWLRRIGLFILLTLLLLGGFLWYAYQQAQVVPEYYQAILSQPAEQLDEAGEEFEMEVLELQNSAIELGTWQSIFSQDQINGWLAFDLPQKFPKALPPAISQPRVALSEDELKLIFVLQSKRFSGVVECSSDVFCTEVVNQFAIRIHHIKSGIVSFPIAAWTDQISEILNSYGCETQWTEEQNDMVLLVSLPADVSDSPDLKLIVTAVKISDEKIVVQGQTMDPNEAEPNADSEALEKE